jgi:hypothetical protein
VGTLHVVSEDLELRLGVNLGAVRQEQVSIGLLGVGLLGLGSNEDLAVEDRVGVSIQNALVYLTSGAVGRGMENGGGLSLLTSPACRGRAVDLQCRARSGPRRIVAAEAAPG